MSRLAVLAWTPLLETAPIGHLVTRLPGMSEPLRSATYSGLVEVPARHYHHPWADPGTSPATHAYYWYTESERDPANDAIILWLQGGPGGSSLGGGFLEMGPLRLDDRSYATAEYNASGVPTPLRNDASWTTFAGLILLEYADIGFSSVDNRTLLQPRYKWNIGSATESIVGFLSRFFELFPERRGRPLWIAGESFAGNLVTTVASALDAKSRDLGFGPAGVLHGNGATGDYQGAPDPMGGLEMEGPPLNTGDMGPLDVQGHVDFWWRAGLTSTKMYNSVIQSCPSLGRVKPDKKCRELLKEMTSRIGNPEKLGTGTSWWNVYNIYDTCSDMPHLRSVPRGVEHSATWVCGGMRAIGDYFNRAEVQQAIHVPRTHGWKMSDDAIRWHHPKEGLSLLDEIKRLAKRYPFLVYSGDADAQIPHTVTELWTSSLGLDEVSPYQKWTLDGYVQGYVTEYEGNFTFATVKGAGHMVPQFRPEAAKAMVSRFISTHRLAEVPVAAVLV